MNEKHDLQNDKIKPLFQAQTPPEALDAEAMLRFLDESDESETKRAFLNQCALSSEALDDWRTLNETIDAGKELPESKPDPAIRARVLDAAFAAAQGIEVKPVRSSRRSSGIPGWKWAWAALFLAMLWSGYQEFQPASTYTSSNITTVKDSLDYELLSLEAEMQELQSELSLDLGLGVDGSA